MKIRYFLFLGISLLAIFLGWKFLPIPTMNRNNEVSPIEDLMQEHGILNRILLIYEEIIARIDEQETLPHDAIQRSAEIVRNFLENYHEKLEEDYVFPLLERNKTMTDLIRILQDQHKKGRILTDYILAHSTDSEKKDSPEQEQLEDAMQLFIDMYRPHAAREDSVVFPTFKQTISKNEYSELTTIFENKEREVLGQDGFTRIANDVATLEKELGIYDLAQFSPEIDQNTYKQTQ